MSDFEDFDIDDILESLASEKSANAKTNTTAKENDDCESEALESDTLGLNMHATKNDPRQTEIPEIAINIDTRNNLDSLSLVNKLPEREHNYTFENIPNKLSTQQAINRNLDDISTPSFLLPKKTSSQNEISTGDNLLEIMGLGEMDKTVKRKSSSKSFTSSSHSVDTPFIASSTQSKKDEVEMPSFLFKQDSTGNIPAGRRRRLPPPDEEKRRSVLTLDQPLKSDSNTGTPLPFLSGKLSRSFSKELNEKTSKTEIPITPLKLPSNPGLSKIKSRESILSGSSVAISSIASLSETDDPSASSKSEQNSEAASKSEQQTSMYNSDHSKTDLEDENSAHSVAIKSKNSSLSRKRSQNGKDKQRVNISTELLTAKTNHKESKQKEQFTLYKCAVCDNTRTEFRILKAKLEDLAAEDEKQIRKLRSDLITSNIALEKSRTLVQDLEKEINDTKFISRQEKMEMRDELEGVYKNEINLLKEAHAKELEKLKKDNDYDLKHQIQVEISKINIKHDHEITILKKKHFEEINKVVSGADSTAKFAELVKEVEESTRKVSLLQQQLELEHASNNKERENQICERENKLELSKSALKEKEKLLDQEIKKAKDTSTKYENAHKEFEKRMKEDEVTLAAETARLQDLHEESKAELSKKVEELNREKLLHLKNKEEWMLNRRKMLETHREEQDKLGHQKAELECKLQCLSNMETESKYFKAREESQINIDRMMISQELHSLKIKQGELHPDVSNFRSERIKLESAKVKFEAELEIFLKDRNEIEEKYKSTQLFYEKCVAEKKSSELLQKQNEQTQYTLANLKAEIAKKSQELEDKRNSYMNERVVIAQERNEMMKYKHSLDKKIADDKENFAEHEKEMQRRNTKLQNSPLSERAPHKKNDLHTPDKILDLENADDKSAPILKSSNRESVSLRKPYVAQFATVSSNTHQPESQAKNHIYSEMYLKERSVIFRKLNKFVTDFERPSDALQLQQNFLNNSFAYPSLLYSVAIPTTFQYEDEDMYFEAVDSAHGTVQVDAIDFDDQFSVEGIDQTRMSTDYSEYQEDADNNGRDNDDWNVNSLSSY